MNIVNYKRSTAYKGGYSSYLDGTFHKYQATLPKIPLSSWWRNPQ